MPMSNIPKGMEGRVFLPHEYYDTIALTPSVIPQPSFFVDGIGKLLAAGIPKTKAHTNLETSGQIPGGNDFLVEGIKLQTLPLLLPDADFRLAVCKFAYLELVINSNPVAQWPIYTLTAAAGVFVAGSPVLSYTQLGMPQQNNYRKFKGGRKPWIKSSESFSVNLNFAEATGAFTPPVYLHCTLAGVLAKDGAVAHTR